MSQLLSALFKFLPTDCVVAYFKSLETPCTNSRTRLSRTSKFAQQWTCNHALTLQVPVFQPKFGDLAVAGLLLSRLVLCGTSDVVAKTHVSPWLLSGTLLTYLSNYEDRVIL